MWPRTRAQRASMLPRLQRCAACRYNELELRWTTKETWVFQRTFNVSAAQLNYSSIDLLLTGVDTVAEISVDDVRLASVANAHRRAATWAGARHLPRSARACACRGAAPSAAVPLGRWQNGGGGPSAHPAMAPTTSGRSHRASVIARRQGGVSRAAPMARALGVCAQGVQAAGQGCPEQHGGRAHAEDPHLPGARCRAGQRVCLPLQGPWCGARPRRRSALVCGSAAPPVLGQARGAASRGQPAERAAAAQG